MEDPTIVKLVEMLKKVYIGSMKRPFKKDITLIEVALHMKYIEPVYLAICGKLWKILVQILYQNRK